MGLFIALAAAGFLAADEREAEPARPLETARYLHRVALADQALARGDSARAEAFLDECPAAQRRWEWHYLKRRCDPSVLTIKRHEQAVLAVAYRPDGRRLASAGKDGTVKVCDAETGQLYLTLRGHTGPVFAVAYSADGSRLLSASRGARGPDFDDPVRPGEIKVWDAATGKSIRSDPADKGFVYSVGISPDGKRVALAAADDKLRVWNVDDGKTVFSADQETPWVTFLPNGKQLAAVAGQGGRTIHVRDAETGKVEKTLKPGKPAFRFAVRPDGKRLAALGAEDVAVLDVESGKTLHTFTMEPSVGALEWTADGSGLVLAVDRKPLRVLDAETGRVRHTWHHGSLTPYGLAVEPSGKRVAVAFGGDQIEEQLHNVVVPGVVKVYDPARGPDKRVLTGHTGAVKDVRFSADGARLLSVGADKTARVWDVADGRVVAKLEGHKGPAEFGAFLPDGKQVVTATQEELKVWNLADGKPARTVALQGHTRMTLSADGKWLAFGDRRDTRVHLLQLDGDRKLDLEGVRGNGVIGLGFSPDGKHLVAGYGGIPGSYRVWTAEVDNSSPGPVVIWDAATGKEVRRLEGQSGYVWPYHTIFSPDGKSVAAAEGDGWGLMLWDAATGKLRARIRPVDRDDYRLAFTPDGRRLLAASDRALDVWDAATGEPVLTLPGTFATLAVSPDGMRVAAGRGNDIVLLETAPPQPEETRRRREAIAYVDRLLDQGRTRAEVVAQLGKDDKLTEPQRKLAREVAETTEENVAAIYAAHWPVVSKSDGKDADYRRALESLQVAAKLEPRNTDYQLAVGAALYRVGKDKEAVETLQAALKRRGADELPPEEVFLAMAYHRLGDEKMAKQHLLRIQNWIRNLEEILGRGGEGDKKPAAEIRRLLRFDENLRLLREAEKLLENRGRGR
jgi:WD40 repeat protein